jgi:hypothetical protein
MIVQEVFGEGYYPHFLRLNRLIENAQDPSANLTHLKSFIGIKSITALNSYLGTAERNSRRPLII